ncbi:MAG: hypothetical protein DME20_00055 [Verrucomicrobia bacterium]|nr:MAG: hypothetical protein DME20_00055 [Verrucomicrobiota bacterium]
MDAPPKEKRGVRTALLTARLRRDYRARRWLASVIREPNTRGYGERRECVCCGLCVTNATLGGHCGRSPMTGPLYCLCCADWPPQLLLNFERPEQ